LDDYSNVFYRKEGIIYEERNPKELAGSSAEFLFTRWKRFLNGNPNRPTLSVIWFNEPHIPFVAKEEHVEACLAGLICHLDRVPDMDGATSHYLGTVYELDRVVGLFIDELKLRGMWRDALVSFTSDNGPEIRRVGGRGTASILRGYKRDAFEGGHRVTGLVSYPREVRRNLVWRQPASAIDYLPTLLDVWGYEDAWEEVVEGESLLPILRDATAAALAADEKGEDPWAAARAAHARSNPIVVCGGGFDDDRCNNMAWIENDLKYVRTPNGRGFFNLTHDIGESLDLTSPKSSSAFMKALEERDPERKKFLENAAERLRERAEAYRDDMLAASDAECGGARR